MILLTDDEQAVALRAARFTLSGLQVRHKRGGDDVNEVGRSMLQVETLIHILERPERNVTNGVWCCKCPRWQQPTQASCEKCSAEKPNG